MNRAYSHQNPAKLWQPKKHHVICSEHFLGGSKIDEQNNAVFPSIFPTHLVSTEKSEREERLERRKERRMEREIAELERRELASSIRLVHYSKIFWEETFHQHWLLVGNGCITTLL